MAYTSNPDLDPPIFKYVDPDLDVGYLKLIKMICWTKILKKADPPKNVCLDLAMQPLFLGLFC